MQSKPQDRWLFRLWLECLAQAGRDENLRELAVGFWRGNRARDAEIIAREAPTQAAHAKALATAVIALDIGLAIQHHVDPEDVPLELYPELYTALFSSLGTSDDADPS